MQALSSCVVCATKTSPLPKPSCRTLYIGACLKAVRRAVGARLLSEAQGQALLAALASRKRRHARSVSAAELLRLTFLSLVATLRRDKQQRGLEKR